MIILSQTLQEKVLKPILLLIFIVVGFLTLLSPTRDKNHWVINQTGLINRVSTASQAFQSSITLSSQLVAYCIDQLGSLETASNIQQYVPPTKGQREIIPTLSYQEITSSNRLFFDEADGTIDPDGRLGKGVAKGYVQGGFAHYDNMTQVVAGVAGHIGSYLTPGVQEAAAVRDYTALAYHASNASVDIMSHGLNWQNGTELGTSVVGMYIGGSSTASIVVSGMDRVGTKVVQSVAASEVADTSQFLEEVPTQLNHRDAIRDFKENPNDWERSFSQAGPSTRKGNNNGINIESIWKNRKTGQELSTHEAFFESGESIHPENKSPNLPGGGAIRPPNRNKIIP